MGYICRAKGGKMRLAPARKADRVLSMLLVLADLITIPITVVFSFVISWFFRENNFYTLITNGFIYTVAIPITVPVWLITFAANGLYYPQRFLGSMGEVQKLIKVLVYVLVSLMAIFFILRIGYPRTTLFAFIVLALPIASTMRILARKLAQIVAPVREVPRLLVVGAGQFAVRVIQAIGKLPGKAPEVVGVLTANGDMVDEVGGIRVAGNLAEISDICDKMKIDEVFFAEPDIDRSLMLDIISSMSGKEIHFRLVTDLFEIAISGTDIDDLAKLPIIEIGYGKPGLVHRIIKRTMDLVLSSALLLLLSPILLVIYVVLLVSRRGSPFFLQQRAGLDGNEFTLIKFRTMKPEADEYEVAPVAMNDPRITGFGKFLRRTSFDELPQLLNILVGSMSLVGPRPEMSFIVKDYKTWQRHRLDVKPGLTGLWQIMGRKDLPLHENIEYDFYYIRNQSIMLDIAIIIRTISTIIKGKGAY